MYIKSIVIGDINFTLDLIIKRLKDKELKHDFRMISGGSLRCAEQNVTVEPGKYPVWNKQP